MLRCTCSVWTPLIIYIEYLEYQASLNAFFQCSKRTCLLVGTSFKIYLEYTISNTGHIEYLSIANGETYHHMNIHIGVQITDHIIQIYLPLFLNIRIVRKYAKNYWISINQIYAIEFILLLRVYWYISFVAKHQIY